MLDFVELGVRRLHVIEKSSWCRYDYVEAAAKRVLLRSHANSADDDGGGYRRVSSDRFELFHDLRRQLTCRCEDERARGAARTLDQLVEDREKKSSSLAAASRCACEDIPSGDCGRYCVSLDGSGTNKSKLFQSPEEAWIEIQ